MAQFVLSSTAQAKGEPMKNEMLHLAAALLSPEEQDLLERLGDHGTHRRCDKRCERLGTTLPRAGSADLPCRLARGKRAAAISATFRDSGGLWEKVRVEDVATLRAFQKNPGLVYDF